MNNKYPTKQEFTEYIKQSIDFQKWERERKSRLFKLISIEIILLLCLWLCFQLIKYLTFSSAFAIILLIVCLIILIFFLILPSMYYCKFKEDFKKACIKDIKRFFALISFGKKGINKYELQKSKLFSDFKDITYDDKFKGTYNDVSFIIAELVLDNYNDDDKSKLPHTVFRGIVITFDSNKKIEADTIVTTKNNFSILNIYNVGITLFLGAITLISFVHQRDSLNWDNWKEYTFILIIFFLFPAFIFFIPSIISLVRNNILKKSNGMKEVHIEDINFAKQFRVYSADQIDSRYLLTTSFIDRYNNLRTAFGVKKVRCSFYDDKIMFAIPTSIDHFELVSLFSPVGSDIESFYDQIASIYEMIDYFKFNERTGL